MVGFNGLLAQCAALPTYSPLDWKKLINNADPTGESSLPCLPFRIEAHIHNEKDIMESHSLADRSMSGCNIASIRRPSPSSSLQTCMQTSLSLDLFSSADHTDGSKWIHCTSTIAHRHEFPSQIKCFSLLEVSQATHIPLALIYEGVKALSSARQSP